MMRKYLKSAFLFALVLAAGCATSVSDYNTTARDEEKYESKDVESLDYDTGTYVLQTKGGGAIACINIGAKDGIRKGAKIEFFQILKRNKDKFEVVVATGKVFYVSETTSWVSVNDYETANVKINLFARLAADQSKNLHEKMMGWLGLE
jgi:lipopolysaccharide export LptBFGC system permease protein LptF